jgi:hypothetical protein
VQAGGIRGVKEPHTLCCLLQVARDHIGLDHREQILLVDLEDAIQPLEAEHDTAAHRHRATGVAGACSPHHQRHARRVTLPCDGRDFPRVRRYDDQIGGVALLKGVRAVREQRLRVAADPLGPDDCLENGGQLTGDGHGFSFRLSPSDGHTGPTWRSVMAISSAADGGDDAPPCEENMWGSPSGLLTRQG